MEGAVGMKEGGRRWEKRSSRGGRFLITTAATTTDILNFIVGQERCEIKMAAFEPSPIRVPPPTHRPGPPLPRYPPVTHHLCPRGTYTARRICRYWSAGRLKRGCRPLESRGEAAVADNDTTFPSTAAGARLLRRWRRYTRSYSLIEPSPPSFQTRRPPTIVRSRCFTF